jgi:type II secretion system protein H
LGFTLVELVLVMIIIGVIAAVAMPRFAQANARQQLDAAAKRVEADLEKARHQARSTSNWVAVRFDPAANSYEYVPAIGGNRYEVLLTDAPYQVELSSAVFAGGTDVTFNGFGIPTSNGIIVLQSAAGTAAIKLDASGGVTR